MSAKALLGAAVMGLLLMARPVPGVMAQLSLYWTFDVGADGWRVAIGPGQVRTTSTREHVKVGTGSLESSYAIAPHTYFAITKLVNIPDHPVVALSFWLRSTQTGLLSIFLIERGGSAYSHPVAAPVGHWKRVAISSKQFALDTGSPTNTDENHRLDVGQISWITIADFTGLFSSDRLRGSFYLDDFRVEATK